MSVCLHLLSCNSTGSCAEARFVRSSRTRADPPVDDKSFPRQASVAALRVIPVIDLLHGQVVHARKGEQACSARSSRRSRQPATRWMSCVAYSRSFPSRRSMSPISTRSRAMETMSRRCAAFATRFRRCRYGSTMARRPPPRSRRSSARTWARQSSAANRSATVRLSRSTGTRGGSCSRSISRRGFSGPHEILAEPALWPSRVIVLTLAQVGSAAGPDLPHNTRRSCRSPAGGNSMPRAACATRTISGAQGRGRLRRLIATALHEQRIGAADLKSM